MPCTLCPPPYRSARGKGARPPVWVPSLCQLAATTKFVTHGCERQISCSVELIPLVPCIGNHLAAVQHVALGYVTAADSPTHRLCAACWPLIHVQAACSAARMAQVPSLPSLNACIIAGRVRLQAAAGTSTPFRGTVRLVTPEGFAAQQAQVDVYFIDTNTEYTPDQVRTGSCYQAACRCSPMHTCASAAMAVAHAVHQCRACVPASHAPSRASTRQRTLAAKLFPGHGHQGVGPQGRSAAGGRWVSAHACHAGTHVPTGTPTNSLNRSVPALSTTHNQTRLHACTAPHGLAAWACARPRCCQLTESSNTSGRLLPVPSAHQATRGTGATSTWRTL